MSAPIGQADALPPTLCRHDRLVGCLEMETAPSGSLYASWSAWCEACRTEFRATGIVFRAPGMPAGGFLSLQGIEARLVLEPVVASANDDAADDDDAAETVSVTPGGDVPKAPSL